MRQPSSTPTTSPDTQERREEAIRGIRETGFDLLENSSYFDKGPQGKPKFAEVLESPDLFFLEPDEVGVALANSLNDYALLGEEDLVLAQGIICPEAVQRLEEMKKIDVLHDLLAQGAEEPAEGIPQRISA